MRLNVLKKLIDVNLLYATQESALANLRKKQAKNPQKKVNVSSRILFNYLFVGILYLVLFGGPAFATPLNQMPGQFSNSLIFFLVFIFAQGFLSFYNVFYESRDLDAYIPYAFKESEVMTAKGVVVVFPVLLGILPIIAYDLALNLQSGQPFWLAIPIFLLSVVTIFATLTGLMVVSVHFLTKTSVFKKYKKVISTGLMVFAYLIAFGSLMFMNFVVNQSTIETLETGKIVDQEVYFKPLQVFHSLAVAPFELSSVLGLLGWLAVLGILFALIRFKVVPEFYDAARSVSDIREVKVRRTAPAIQGKSGFKNFVWRYHLGLVGQGTVFLQSVLMSSILPYLMFSGAFIGFMRASGGHMKLEPQFLLTYLLATFLVATINYGGMNLTAIGISLERENFSYLKAMPINFVYYLRLKFWILFILQSILPLVLFLIVLIYLGMPIILLPVLLLFWIVISLGWSSWAYYRDYTHLVTNWSNVTELVNRDNSLAKGLIFLVLFIIIGVGIVVSYIAFSELPVMVGVMVGFIIFLFSTIVLIFVQRHFFKKVQMALLED